MATSKDLERAKFALADIEAGKVVKPAAMFIGQSKASAKLYQLEESRGKIIGQCAVEWSKFFDVDKSEYWSRAIPQALFDTLDGHSTSAGMIAAEAYLERYGYKVERPKL